jgi:hypothetical protein
LAAPRSANPDYWRRKQWFFGAAAVI